MKQSTMILFQKCLLTLMPLMIVLASKKSVSFREKHKSMILKIEQYFYH